MRDPTSDAAATRRLILILSICGCASTFAIRSLDPLIGVIARDLRSDPHTIALLATAFAIPSAFFSRSWPRRRCARQGRIMSFASPSSQQRWWRPR